MSHFIFDLELEGGERREHIVQGNGGPVGGGLICHYHYDEPEAEVLEHLRVRVERLAKRGPLRVLVDPDLEPSERFANLKATAVHAARFVR